MSQRYAKYIDGSDLAQKLFDLVERDQGYAHISDGLANTNPDPTRVLDIARSSLHYTNSVARKLRKFIRDNTP